MMGFLLRSSIWWLNVNDGLGSVLVSVNDWAGVEIYHGLKNMQFDGRPLNL